MGEEYIFHYPPELTSLLIDTIPCLCRSKNDVLLFFRGAGIPESLYNDYKRAVQTDRDQIKKHEIVRGIITRINENGDKYLRERREVIKRVVEFENFSACWPGDVLKAKGLIYEIRQLVNVKDSFTRMKDALEAERIQKSKEQQQKLEEKQRHKQNFERIKSSFYGLFGEKNPQLRGKKLEDVLNDLFKHFGILIKEAFEIRKEGSNVIYEQIDGVVEIDAHIYLVEMKWLNSPADINDVSRHLMRVFTRGNVGGIVISASGYTEPAINTCREVLSQKTIVLCTLEEIVRLLEKEEDLASFFKSKIQTATIYKEPC